MADIKCPACGAPMVSLDGLPGATYQECDTCGFDRLVTDLDDDTLLALWDGTLPDPVDAAYTFTHTWDADGVLTTTARRNTHA